MSKPASAVFFLDEGVPVSVGKVLKESGFEVIFFDKAALGGTPDPVICDIAIQNDAVLVALDGDMRQIAKQSGVSRNRYKSLSLLKLSCREPSAAGRVKDAIPFLRLQLNLSHEQQSTRSLYAEIGNEWIKIFRQD